MNCSKKYYSILNYPTFSNTGWQTIFFLSLLKFRMIFIVLAWMNPNMTTKFPYHPPMLRRRDWIQKLCLYTKSTILVFNYNIHYKTMDNVSIYAILTTKKKKFIKCPLCLLFPLIPTSWCFPYKALAAAIQHIYISTFHCTSFQFGKCPDGTFHHIHWRIFLSNQAWYAGEVHRFLTYPLKQDVPNSSDLVLFLNGVAIFFYSVVAVSCLAVPITYKAAEFCVSALQPTQHCQNF